MPIKNLLKTLKTRFKQNFLIEKCCICGFPSDFFTVEYYIDMNQVIQLEIKFYCFNCDFQITHTKFEKQKNCG